MASPQENKGHQIEITIDHSEMNREKVIKHGILDIKQLS